MFKIKVTARRLNIKFWFIKFSISRYKVGLTKDFYVDLFFKFIRLFDIILPKDENKIVFCLTNSNINAGSVYYDYLLKNYKNKYKCIILLDNLSYDKWKTNNVFTLNTLRGIFEGMTSKYVIVTNCSGHLSIFTSKKHHYLFLNHGMPIKKMAFSKPMKNVSYKRNSTLLSGANFLVTSDIFKQLIISCYKADYSKVFVTGTARNDIIGSSTDDTKINEMFNLNEYSKVVLYLPTYKMSRASRHCNTSRDFNNIFYFDDYDEQKFIEILESNNILFIMKPHPKEEFFYRENPEVLPKTKNFRLVDNREFFNRDIEYYQLFKFADLMISDYSSAPIDFLILDKPVLYLNNLAEDYSSKRGMILEDNYEILMPGLKAVTFEDFKVQFLDCLYKDSYKSERERLLPLIHKYRDFNSCKRICEVMESLK